MNKSRKLFLPPILGLCLAVLFMSVCSWQSGTAAFASEITLSVLDHHLLKNDASSAPQDTEALTRYVATDGVDTGTCINPASPCATPQYAVDQSSIGDEIHAAAGVYNGVQARAGITQVVYISRSLTLRGGYNPDFSAWDPDAYPTTLDAEGQGRVVYLSGEINATLDGLEITGGDAWASKGAVGGGIYAVTATLTLSNCQIYSNTAWMSAGAVYLLNGSVTFFGNEIHSNDSGGVFIGFGEATLISNTIQANTSQTGDGGLEIEDSDVVLNDNIISGNNGGGLSLLRVAATLDGNTISDNISLGGGGVYLEDSDVVLSNNLISGNIAGGRGGGLHLNGVRAALENNTISGNAANQEGGGLFVFATSEVTLTGNTIVNNSTNRYGGGLYVSQGEMKMDDNTVANNWAKYSGGGVELHDLTASLTNNWIYNNTLEPMASVGQGGGIYLDNSVVSITGNQVYSNTIKASGQGGGVYLQRGNAILTDNSITVNTSGTDGGGLYLSYSEATLISNTISGNATGSSGDGGGFFINMGNPTLIGNIISGNTASQQGGGLYLDRSNATLTDNSISNNTASYSGGGLFLYQSNATLTDNTISNNMASGGGGLYLINSGSILRANTISANSSTHDGGGAYLDKSNVLLENNMVVDNQITGAYKGAGLYIKASSPQFRHTTIARNSGGDGRGLFITHYSSTFSNVELYDTLIAGQTEGIFVNSGSTASLDTTLWGNGAWANGTDWAGAGTINTSGNLWGDPDFINPAIGDYHIDSASAAIDVGIDAGLNNDIDDQARPIGKGFDIGADEYPGAAIWVQKTAWQSQINGGQILTFTVVITSVGDATATGLIFTDTLPVQQSPQTAVPSQGSCVVGQDWGEQVICDLGDLETSSTAQVTLTVLITTPQTGTLPQTMRNTVWVEGDNAANQAFADTYLHDCHVRVNGALPEFELVQPAVDAAVSGDTVWVAGTCAGINERGGLRQSVYLTKTLTLRGGYSTDFSVWDPEIYPTTLHGLDQGRVVYIKGPVQPTLESLGITHGNAVGLGGIGGIGAGGGMAVLFSSGVTISNCLVTDNQAINGGGLFLDEADATLTGNTFIGNAASSSGGGLYLEFSDSPLSNNTVMSNTASSSGGGLYIYQGLVTLEQNIVEHNTASITGGGLYLYESDSTLANNTVLNNTASGDGGGLYLYKSDAALEGNTVSSNTTSGKGGGLFLFQSVPILTANTISDNHSTSDGGGLYLDNSDGVTFGGNTISGNNASSGGGLFLYYSNVTLEDNLVTDNTTSDKGGGLYMFTGISTLHGNTISSNTASYGGGLYMYSNSSSLDANTIISNTTSKDGGGLLLDYNSDARLDNNIIADNHVTGFYKGAGLYIQGSDPILRHTTIARNSGGDGSGLYITKYSSIYCRVVITNTIIVSQTMGIVVSTGNTAWLEATLWGSGTWTNGTDWTGAGTIDIGSINLWGDPDFVDPTNGDYHIDIDSAALDVGVDAGLTHDIDGDPRPFGSDYDLGADEFFSGYKVYLPLIVR